MDIVDGLADRIHVIGDLEQEPLQEVDFRSQMLFAAGLLLSIIMIIGYIHGRAWRLQKSLLTFGQGGAGLAVGFLLRFVDGLLQWDG